MACFALGNGDKPWAAGNQAQGWPSIAISVMDELGPTSVLGAGSS